MKNSKVDMSDWIEANPEKYEGHLEYMRVYQARSRRKTDGEIEEQRIDVPTKRVLPAAEPDTFVRGPAVSLADGLRAREERTRG
jgi:hypothetical protein